MHTKIEFSYSEPSWGEIETDYEISEEEAIRLIEQSYPEAYDIEILNITEEKE